MPSADRDSLSSATVVPVKLVQIRDVVKTFIGRHTACVLQLLDGCRARLGADAGSLLLHLVDFHHLLLAGFDRHSRPSFLLSITIKPLKCLERHADIGLKRSHVI